MIGCLCTTVFLHALNKESAQINRKPEPVGDHNIQKTVKKNVDSSLYLANFIRLIAHQEKFREPKNDWKTE